MSKDNKTDSNKAVVAVLLLLIIFITLCAIGSALLFVHLGPIVPILGPIIIPFMSILAPAVGVVHQNGLNIKRCT